MTTTTEANSFEALPCSDHPVRFETADEVLDHVRAHVPAATSDEVITACAEELFEYFRHPQPGYYRILNAEQAEATIAQLRDGIDGSALTDSLAEVRTYRAQVHDVTELSGEIRVRIYAEAVASETASGHDSAAETVTISIPAAPCSEGADQEMRRVLIWQALITAGWMPVRRRCGTTQYLPRPEFTLEGPLLVADPTRGRISATVVGSDEILIEERYPTLAQAPVASEILAHLKTGRGSLTPDEAAQELIAFGYQPCVETHGWPDRPRRWSMLDHLEELPPF